MAVSRRPPPVLPDVGQGTWNGVRGPVYRALKWLIQGYSGIPGGFRDLNPSTIQAGVSKNPGTEAASWAAADHVHDVETFAPSHPTGIAPSEGTGTRLMRADATIQQGIVTTKGDVLTYSSVPARLPVGSDGQVLTADSAQTTGLKWSTNSATDADAQLLAWAAIALAAEPN
jgi:hypothetical protein